MSSNWLHTYTAAMQRAPPMKKVPGVHPCAVCCTIFSIVGALFLFVIGGLLNSHYPYIHIPGNTATLSQQTVYAGLVYLVLAIVSIIFWVRGAQRTGQLSRSSGQFQQVR